MVKIERLFVTGINQDPESSFVELSAEDHGFIPRFVSLFLNPDEAKLFHIGQEVVVTLEKAPSPEARK